MSLRDLNQISIERNVLEPVRNISNEMSFCDVFKTSQIHLEKGVFFDVFKTSQKHLKKDIFLCDVSSISRAYLKKDVFSVTSLRRLKNISRKYFWFFKNTSQK